MTLLSLVSGRLPAQYRKRRSHLIPVLLSTAISIAAVSAVSYLLWPTWTPDDTHDPSRLPVIIGKTLFDVPTESVRMKVQQHSGPQERIDLSFAYPPREKEDALKVVTANVTNVTAPAIDLIFLSIAAHTDTLSPEERVRTIYPRYLDAGPPRAFDGLGMSAFRDNTPYANEDLFAATSPYLLARCTRDGETPGMCLSENRIEGVDLTFRFPRSWLTNWRGVTDAMNRIVAQIYKPRS